MGSDKSEKILINKNCIDMLISGLKNIKISSREKSIKKEAEKMLNLIEEELYKRNISLKQKILEKMKETKSTDPNMNANLYILYRNLDSGQISEEQALELFKMYVKMEPYDRTI
ncbi:hypothetical protein ACFHWD_06030 [Clostridium sp. MT-14]|uniref:Uncharacterized protein n=1 Tax=Clostridium aromativorans TaxID=2836848 RepID=A0ABS8N2J7_9CLOT|nr:MULTISPECIES: hypothetical protein [Clostridium]KAA8675178.1 hypothetical protein F3O63_05260 [Clostridium sp. HV4-5-A1G]MCC9293970.1 hypothetical protein [Clostridium aromativorans]CAB1241963.1 conserved hypothetical protein [Clostridiaceae bacterium BL-3]